MDAFKKANIKEYTAYDLNAKCVCIAYKERRKLKRVCSKKSRAKLKREICL